MVQTAVGVVLLAAAGAKIVGQVSVRTFLDALSVPPQISAPVARVLPVAEGLCGGLLVLRWGGDAVVLAAAALTAGFAITLVVAYVRGVTTGCRCFGVLDSGQLTPVAVARAIVLAIATIALLTWGTSSNQPGTTAMSLGVLAALAYIASFAVLEQVYEFERGRSAVFSRLKANHGTAAVEEAGR